jgi:hypothetical protein
LNVEKPASGIDASVDLVDLLPDTIDLAHALRRIAQIVAKPATKSLLAGIEDAATPVAARAQENVPQTARSTAGAKFARSEQPRCLSRRVAVIIAKKPGENGLDWAKESRVKKRGPWIMRMGGVAPRKVVAADATVEHQGVRDS